MGCCFFMPPLFGGKSISEKEEMEECAQNEESP